ncbi:MAG: UvrD-helicase domain-containing protein [Bacillota bacterium]|nr:UvrD-helicase domain-containing protein [Thermoanaerobacteraceae bacterium]
MTDFYGELNSEQLEAVCHTTGPLLVLAGAGSGKTRVLTCRIAHLIHDAGVRPENILAITFTNKAAREMRSRVERLLPHDVRDLWVMTFHAACLRILRREIQHLGRNPDFVIYDEDDRRVLVRECLKETGLDEKRYPPGGMAAAISWAKNWLVGPEEYALRAGTRYEKAVAQVYALYQEKLRRFGALDFDDLLGEAVRLFRECPAVLERCQRRFQFILVDEYQDTNHVQYVWVNQLAERHRNLMVVGDPDQSIFGWRGADISNILNFERDYPEARVIKLEKNYRSTSSILAVADSVIRYNQLRKEKVLRAVKGEGDPPLLFVAPDEVAEANLVAGEIARMRREEGRSYRDCAVLYRTHAQSRVLEEVFLVTGIPYIILGGLRFYERKEIKDLLAYLRLVVNPVDALSLKRIINFPPRGIGAAYLGRLLQHAAAHRVTPVAALLDADAISGLPLRVREEMRRLGELFVSLRGEAAGPVTRVVETLLAETGYERYLLAEGTPEAQARLENIREFLTVTREFDREERGGLAEFLAEIALFTDIDRYDPEADVVALLTLHSAKGLEFPVVFITGMEEGLFPHLRSLDDPAEMEEERRLCYVGITRAKERLFLTRCQMRHLYGGIYANPPSRFLGEMPAESLTVAGGSEEAVPAAQEAAELKPGDRVLHKKWGAGTVVGVAGSGEDVQVTVAFAKAGLKTLLLEYAPLERLVE